MKRLIDIRGGETRRTALAFSILLLVVGAYTVVKAVRDAIFLSQFGLTEISLIAIALAVVAGVVAALYLRLSSGVRRNVLITGTHVAIAATLVLLWLGFEAGVGPTWLPWVLYVWSSLFGLFIVMQFWLLASDLFDVREAKRLFGPIGAGAILGGLVGGVLSRFLAESLGTPTLLLVAAAMLVGAGFLTQLVWGLRREESRVSIPEPDEKPPGLWRLVAEPSYLRLIAVGMLLATVVTTLLDWQFKAIAKHEFASRADDMTAFFGELYAYLSGTSFVLQVLVTGWLLRRYGVGVGRMILPLSLLAGALAILGHGMLPVTLLVVATGAKVAEGGLRFAIDKASSELTWLPLPRRERERGKAFVDTMVDRLGTGITGLLWLGCASVGLDRPGSIHLISLIGAALGVAWLFVLRRTQSAYVDAFRATLARRTLDLDNLKLSLGESEAVRTLGAALESEDAGQVRFALYLLASWSDPLPDLDRALAHEDPTVRRQALELLAQAGDERQREAAAPCLDHDDPEVREAAIVYLRTTAPEGDDPILDARPSDAPQEEFRISLVRLGTPSRAEAAERSIGDALAVTDGADRLEMIRLLGAAPPETAAALLAPLLSHEESGTVEAALRATGRARAHTLVPTLSRMLADRAWRPRVIQSLTDIGAPALDHLVPQLHDPATPLDVKLAIVRLAGASREPSMASELEALVGHEPVELSHRALQALARLRRAHSTISVDRARMAELATRETQCLYRDLSFLGRGSWATVARARTPEDETILSRAVRESADARVRRMFRLLTLLHTPNDVTAAYRGVRSATKATRAKSVEFLDNLLDPDLKQRFLPTLDDANAGQLRGMARSVLGSASEDRVTALRRMIGGPDRWLAAVAAWTAGQERIGALAADLQRLEKRTDDPDLSAVSRHAIRSLDGGAEENDSMALTIVEKALELRGVDVLERASSEDLAFVAQIAEEVELAEGSAVYARGDTPDALYVVVSGAVRLHRGEDEIGVIGPGEAFGTWALFDEAPRLASATAAETTLLLKVDREEFLELLADRADIVQAVFKAMVERIRQLADLGV